MSIMSSLRTVGLVFIAYLALGSAQSQGQDERLEPLVASFNLLADRLAEPGFRYDRLPDNYLAETRDRVCSQLDGNVRRAFIDVITEDNRAIAEIMAITSTDESRNALQARHVVETSSRPSCSKRMTPWRPTALERTPAGSPFGWRWFTAGRLLAPVSTSCPGGSIAARCPRAGCSRA